MADDMWSGWGIRTLSSDHVALQPVQLSHGVGLAPRQRDHRRRLRPLRLPRRGRPDRPRASSTRATGSRRTGSPSCSPACPARTAASRSSTSARTCPRRGRPARSSGSSRSWPGSTPARTRPGRACTSIPTLPDWLPELTMRQPAGRAGRVEHPARGRRARGAVEHDGLRGRPRTARPRPAAAVRRAPGQDARQAPMKDVTHRSASADTPLKQARDRALMAR